MGAPNCCRARSTISMARSTPAQKPRGWASRISFSKPLSISMVTLSQYRNQFDFKGQRLARQGMVEIENGARVGEFAQHAGEPSAAGGGEIDQVAHHVGGAGRRIVVQGRARDGLHHLFAALAKRFAGRKLERFVAALGQADQLL